LIDFLATLAVMMLFMPMLIRLAPRLGLMDEPDSRKLHAGKIPAIGGLALLSAMIAAFLARNPGDWRLLMMLTAGGMLVLAGQIDDRRGLTAFTRFFFQVLACAIMVFLADVSLRDFGQLIRPETLELGLAGIPVTLFCVVGLINAINMVDGMDGLAGSLVLVCLAGVALALMWSGHDVVAFPEIFMLAGGICGFLVFNLRLPWRRHALAFLGDAGTLLVGFVLGWILVEHSQGSGRVIAPVTALWLAALPLMDTVFVMIKRRRAGLPMTQADREHLHHAFLHSGRTQNTTLVVMVAVAIVLAAAGLVMQVTGVPDYISFAAFLLACAVYYAYMSRAWRARRFLSRPLD
jgi:UDP-GlcNAc:undecaprenyl-phosphate GlcNAc-1-phosphate transferase